MVRVSRIVLYKELKKLEKRYDSVLEAKHADVVFDIYVVQHTISIMKYSPQLFETPVDSSEWDFIVKIWGPIIERLFRHSGLRLEW